jgi:hypothetical protein
MGGVEASPLLPQASSITLAAHKYFSGILILRGVEGIFIILVFFSGVRRSLRLAVMAQEPYLLWEA